MNLVSYARRVCPRLYEIVSKRSEFFNHVPIIDPPDRHDQTRSIIKYIHEINENDILRPYQIFMGDLLLFDVDKYSDWYKLQDEIMTKVSFS